MIIRRAENKDIDGLNRLLFQVCMVHHNGRPDLFACGGKKYTDEQLMEIIKDDNCPIFVAVDENDYMLGYSFCIINEYNEMYDEVVEIAANKWYGALVPKHWSTNIDTIDFRLNGVQYKGGH